MLAKPKDLGLTPSQPFLGGIVVHPNTSALDTDMHQAFELGVLLEGEEDRHFEDTILTIKPGDIWLCAAWEPHGWRAAIPNTTEIVLQFLPEFLGEEMLDGISWLSVFAVAPDQRPQVNSEETRTFALAIAHSIRREIHYQKPGWLSSVRLEILRLLLAVCREWQPSVPTPRQRTLNPGNLAKVMPAVRLLHSNPANRLTVGEVAAACGLSLSQFGHTFRQTMGQSFSTFRMRTRLAYAAQLLLTTDWPVERIAEYLTFSDASHLHHAFAKVYNCTPARYRREGLDRRDRIRGYMLVESSLPDDPELKLSLGHAQSSGLRLPEPDWPVAEEETKSPNDKKSK